MLFIVPELASDRRQGVRLDDKIRGSVDVISGVPQGSIYILYCTPTCSSTLLGTLLLVMRMILRSMQSFLDLFRIFK